MIGIVASRADPASVSIRDALLSERDWEEVVDRSRTGKDGGGTVYRRRRFELRTFEGLHLHLDGVAEAFDDPELVVFISRHAGDTGNLLTAHCPGNVGEAAYGGNPNQLPFAAPWAISVLYDKLEDFAPEGYDVSLECTHHGPSQVGAPAVFVEIGSDEDAWTDPRAAAAIGLAVLGLAAALPDASRAFVGIGGGHYAPKFTRIQSDTDWRVGHIAADWALEELSLEAGWHPVLQQAFERTDTDLGVIDGDRPAIEAAAIDRGYRIVTETWLRETTGVSRPVIEQVERVLGPIDEGTRFGTRAGHDLRELHEMTFSSALIDAAESVSRSATRKVVERHAVGFETREAGTRVGRTVLLDEHGDQEAITAALIDLLRQEYDEVTRRDDELELVEMAFDPTAASELGIPEGPLYGALASGQSIEHEGCTIRPVDVMAERVLRIPLSSQ